MWTGAKRAAAEGANRCRISTVAGGVIGGVAAACLVPHAPLLNVLYGPNGYLGFALMALMVAHDGRLLTFPKKTQKEK